jgi:hypothetical protein
LPSSTNILPFAFDLFETVGSPKIFRVGCPLLAESSHSKLADLRHLSVRFREKRTFITIHVL